MSKPNEIPCKHEDLRYDCSPHAQEVGYKPLTPLQRLAATLPSNKAPKKADRERFGPSETQYPASTFPAPLVLPGDDLSFDPTDEPQSLKSWIEGSHRNEVTKSRRTIYLVPSPKIDASVAYVKDWAKPQLAEQKSQSIQNPKIEDIKTYLSAFYHPLPVKLLSHPKLKYVPWSNSKASPSRIGLHTGSSVIGIRTRPSPDTLFSGQLNLSDVLDSAIDILPRDAYALCMLVDQDLYEDEEDDFCCGRAYGGSRVAVVSSARYNPLLDEVQEVEVEHAWPGSHCQVYIDECCGLAPKKKKREKAQEVSGGIRAAVNTSSPNQTPANKRNLFLSRLCKTTSHELGHCFGIAHCVYYACIMQGTAGLSEDARQPPYLCPVDLAKVLYATGADSVERYRALLEFCEGTGGGKGMFGAFAGWLGWRIEEVERVRGEVIVID